MTTESIRSRIMAATILLLVVVYAPLVLAQSTSLQESLSQLTSDRWADRAKAARKIIATPEDLRTLAARNALVDLLQRENDFRDRLAREYLRTGQISPENPGEEFSDYYHESLARVAFAITDLKNRRHLQILANSWYVSWSQWAQKLAEVGEPIVPIAMELTQSDLWDKRDNGLSILTLVLERHKLPAATASRIRQTLVQSVKDDNVGVRWTAVKALGRVGTFNEMPLLQDVARSDPAVDSVTTREELKYPIRNEARKAIEAIRGRNSR